MTWAFPGERENKRDKHSARGNHSVENTHLLLLPEGKETNTRHLDNFEADTRNITLGLAAPTETGDEDLVVLIDEVQATIVLWQKCASAWVALGHPRPGSPQIGASRLGGGSLRESGG